MRATSFLLLIMAGAGLGACHSDPAAPTQVLSLTVDPASGSLPVGSTLLLTVHDAGGGLLSNPSLTFQSSAPQVATIDNAGVVSALSAGTTTLTATSGQFSGTAAILVTPRLAALGLGSNFTCALTDAGSAYCWGNNDLGQLGTGTAAASSVPVPVSGGFVFSSIASGDVSTCGLALSGTAYCWGGNDQGQLGNGTRTNASAPTPIGGQLHFESISVGYDFGCGLTPDHLAYCWGDNAHGQLGTAGFSPSLMPVRVAVGPLSFRSLSAGIGHACALTASGAAYCWGWNIFSQLGDGSSIQRPLPTQVGGGLVFSSIQPGASTTCGIASGVALCWGHGFFGSLGLGQTDEGPDVKLPTAIVGGISLVTIRAGPGNEVFTPGCGVSPTGAAFCWGANTNGQLGAATTPGTCTFGSAASFGCSGTPVPVAGGNRFQVVIPGAEHTCGITVAHSLLCWGLNSDGQLGDGSTQNRLTPVPVGGSLRTP